MKKLKILKVIVDCCWILSITSIPLLLYFIGFVIFSNTLDSFPIKINGIDIISLDGISKGLFITVLLSYLILVYCVFLFRNVLRYFSSINLFDNAVVYNLNKIGIWLLIAAFLDGIPSFCYKVFYEQKIELEIGFSSFLIMICFGLFFLVLSEVFEVAKFAKEENNLTI